MDLDIGVKRIVEVTAHPNADRLDLARIGGYEVVVGRDEYSAGDAVVYIPEGSVLPEWLIAHLGLEGRLAGSRKNRVKAVLLRGKLSQGLVLPLDGGMVENDSTGDVEYAAGVEDMAGFLGVVKYEPPIPVEMSGQVMSCPLALPHYDVEDWKKNPDELAGGKMLAVEKLHGTLTLAAWRCGESQEDGPWVASKGIAHRDQCFKFGDVCKDVLYRRVVDPVAKVLYDVGIGLTPFDEGLPHAICWIGETVGPKVQDLNYGLGKPELVLFEFAHKPTAESPWVFHPYSDVVMAAKTAGVRCAPVVGEIEVSSPVTREEIRRVQAFAKGESVFAGNGQMREGVVLRHPDGRVRKVVSEAYLVRKKGTERR